MDDAMDERMDEAYSPEDSLPEDLRCPAPPSPGTAAPVDPVKCSGPGRRARSGTPPSPPPGLDSPKQERVFSPNTGARPKIINQVPSSDVPPPRHPRVWFLKKNQPIPSNDLILTLTVAPEKGKSDSDVIPDSPASPPPEDRGIYPADLVPAEPVSCQDEDRVISKAPVPKYNKAEFLLTAAVASQHFRQSAYAHGGHIWFQDSSNIGADPKKRRVCSLPLPEQVDQLNVTRNHKDRLLMLPAVLTDFYDFNQLIRIAKTMPYEEGHCALDLVKEVKRMTKPTADDATFIQINNGRTLYVIYAQELDDQTYYITTTAAESGADEVDGFLLRRTHHRLPFKCVEKSKHHCCWLSPPARLAEPASAQCAEPVS